MDFLKNAAGKSYKFLQELDENSGNTDGNAKAADEQGDRPQGALDKLKDFDLESKLEGAASRMFGWAQSFGNASGGESTTLPNEEDVDEDEDEEEGDADEDDEKTPVVSTVLPAQEVLPAGPASVTSSTETRHEPASASKLSDSFADPSTSPEAVTPLDASVKLSASEPSAAELSVAEISVAEPSVAEASVAQPSVAEPSVAEPLAAELSSAAPSEPAAAEVEIEAVHEVTTAALTQIEKPVELEAGHEATTAELSTVEKPAEVVAAAPSAGDQPVPESTSAQELAEHVADTSVPEQTVQATQTNCEQLLNELRLQSEENERHTQELSHARQEISELRCQLENTNSQLGQRERQLADLSNHLAAMEADAEQHREQEAARAAGAEHMAEAAAADARRVADKEAAALRKRAEAAEAARDKALANVETWKERTTVAERRQKEDAADTERELLEAQGAWRKKIAAAEKRATEAASDAQAKVTAAEAELEKARAKVASLQGNVAALESGEDEQHKALQKTLEQSEAERGRLGERLRAAAEVEVQLRRELHGLDDSRAQLEDRCTELTGQLERAQAAYGEAAQELGAMSSRLHELEFGSQVEENSKELEERITDLEKRLGECTWMRDYALQQAEEARAQQAAQRAELESLQQAAASSLEAAGDKGATAGERSGVESAAQAADEVARLQASLEQMAAMHEEDLRKQAHMYRDEAEYLKRKNDEKDRRLEVLICERNALRFESENKASRQACAAPSPGRSKSSLDTLPDLEEGSPSRGSGAAANKQGGSAVQVFLADGDKLLRRFSRVLFVSSITRRVFYGYVILLHFWIWVVLHRTALHLHRA